MIERGLMMFYLKQILLILIIQSLFVLPIVAQEVHDAVRQGDTGKVRVLLQDNPEIVNVKDARGRTPLFVASMKGQIDIA